MENGRKFKAKTKQNKTENLLNWRNMLVCTPLLKIELQKQIEKRVGKYLLLNEGNLEEAEMNPEQQGLLAGTWNRPLLNRNNDS